MFPIECYYTENIINQNVIQFFSKGLNLKLNKVNDYKKNSNIFASYGILRGTGDIIKNLDSYIYLDHGFFNSSKRKFLAEGIASLKNLEGYFRVIKDDLYFNKTFNDKSDERFNKLGISLKKKRSGDIIIVSEPSKNTEEFLRISNWTELTVNEIKKFTDRKVIVHNKLSNIPLSELLQKAFAFVSCQSTAGFYAITEGVPAYFTHASLSRFGNIQEIEKNQLNYDLLCIAANSQWKLNEFFSDEFKIYMNKILNHTC